MISPNLLYTDTAVSLGFYFLNILKSVTNTINALIINYLPLKGKVFQ